ncbi:DNA topoisomerase IV subunit A, partial [Xenorhabdus bovienii]|nr:DNA topoisomerase IV subunit A [Xenorhabdus bovienii]
LPQLSKGKGNKIVSVPAAQAASGEDMLSWLLVLSPQSSITLYFGKRKLQLRPEDLQKFRAERGRKGTSLPRGLQRVERIVVEMPK